MEVLPIKQTSGNNSSGFHRPDTSLQCFGTIGLILEEHLTHKNSNHEVLVWLSVCTSALNIIHLRHCNTNISCFIKIQKGFTSLVPTYPGLQIGCPYNYLQKVIYNTQKYVPLTDIRDRSALGKIKIHS